MLERKLIDIGLGEKEARAYVALVQSGSQSISDIAKKARLNRGTAYVALNSLLERGLVNRRDKNEIQIFTAEDPARIVSYLESQEYDLLIKRRGINKLVDELKLISNPYNSKPNIQYFNGIEGVRAAYDDTLNSKEKTLSCFFAVDDMDEFLGSEYLIAYTKKRISLGFSLKVIQTNMKAAKARKRKAYADIFGNSQAARRQVRYIKDDLSFPVTLYMYDNKVLIISSKEENFALLITSQEFADMQKKIFLNLWKSLRGQT